MLPASFLTLNPDTHILHRFPNRPLQYVSDGCRQLVVMDFLSVQIGFKFNYQFLFELLHTILKQLRDNRVDELFCSIEVFINVLVVWWAGVGNQRFSYVFPSAFFVILRNRENGGLLHIGYSTTKNAPKALSL